MKIIITEEQYKRLQENFDTILDIYSKKSRGEVLKPSEIDILRAFDKFQKKGGNPQDFIFNQDDIYDIDEREGMKFKYNLKGRPFIFEFSEEVIGDNEIEYHGEIKFMGDEFWGAITTDSKGYLIDYDFYSILQDEDIRLQDVLRNENSDAEIQNFFQEEVIPSLKN
jgi:hypothetical protein